MPLPFHAATMFKKSQQNPEVNPFQAFILEPILTPSALVDTGLDDSPDLDGFEGDGDLFDDQGIQEPNAWAAEFDAMAIDLIPFAATQDPDYTGGVFTVHDPSGKVEIDFLFDGGAYDRGEVAIFSLTGMEEFEAGSHEFIQEAARRALTNSELGHVVISDATDGARFSGSMAGEGDFNSGDYQRVQGYQMKAGDRFGVMLAANHSMEELIEGKTWNVRFSMSTDDTSDALQFGQVADVTGDGNTFAFEDLDVSGRSDRDYNDIVFQVRGATAETALMDDVVADGRDWRTQDMGQALIEYANAYTDNIEYTAAQFEAAQEFQPLVGVIDTGVDADAIGLDADEILTGSDFIDGDDNSLLAAGEGDDHGTQVVDRITEVNDDAPLWVGRAIGSGRWAESLVEFVDAAVESEQPNAVVNLSFDLTQIDDDGNVTTRTEFTPMEMAALEYARHNNVLVVAASGNQGALMSALGQASEQFDNIITVGAAEHIDPNASNWQGYDRAAYSSYGQGLDILANGGNGTSMAAAQVTGAIAQVWAANPNLSYQQAIAIVKQTATDLGDANPDLATGAGLLNVAAAVHLAKTMKAEEYEKELQYVPLSWSGEGEFIPMERAANPDATGSGISLGSFLNIFKNPVSQGFTKFLKNIYARFYSTPSNWFFQTHRGTDNRVYTRFYKPLTGEWTSWQKADLSNEVTYHQPAVATLNGVVYQTHVGQDNKIYTRSSTDGVTWTGWQRPNVGNEQTDHAVAMVAFEGRLYQSHIGSDQKIYTRSSTDGVNWTGWQRPNIQNEATEYPIAMAALNGKLYQTHVGSDQKIYTRSSTDGVNWTGWQRPNIENEQTDRAVAMAAFNGRLYQSHVGSDQKIYTRSSTDGVNWTGWKQENIENEVAHNAPVLATFGGKLYQYHVGNEQPPEDGGVMYSRSTSDGENWSAWENMDGARTPIESSGNYYPELASLSDYDWDQQSGDDNQFRSDSPFGGGNQMHLTSDVVRQVYTDLSNHIFGYRVHMNSGYAYDDGYYNWKNRHKWHAGIDMGSLSGTPIKAVIGGTVKWVNSDFMGVDSDDGNHWVYGHLGTKYVSEGQRIEPGTTLAKLDGANHLHLEVQHGYGYKQTNGAHPNQSYVRNVTMSPLQAYWQWKNS
jgi:murein DD-endopeptidase MepM/ murein hydrolase activator NlpD